MYRFSVSVCALMAAAGTAFGAAPGPVANTTAADVNILNLLSPFLGLNGTPVGRQTLSANLQQAIATNNAANLALQQLAISDKSILGSASNNLASVGLGTYGVAANLAGGLPAQTAVNGITPQQTVGGFGTTLGPIYQQGVQNGTAGPLANTVNLLTSAYSFTSVSLGVAKFYFANGTINGTANAVAPTGSTLPTANGLPNKSNSVYDLAYGVSNTQTGQNVFGDSRPVQVAPDSFNKFDPTALSGLTTNPSFPSGHTTYAFTDSILLAMLVPQEYQGMMLRASAYGNSRIVLGVHYPLDIIAARALASYDLSQAFTNPAYINNAAVTGTAIDLGTQFALAAPQIQTYLATQCGAAVATCAASAANNANNPYTPSAANQALYQQRLTYGLPTLSLMQAPHESAPSGGPDASILLAPLYGGSTAAAQQIAPTGGLEASLQTDTINRIIENTETKAIAAFYGTALSYWTRLDLYSAGGYFHNVVGTLSLASSDLVTTDVTIGRGTLAANGRITGATSVTGHGTLAGSGTTSSVSLAAGGVLAPGSLAAQQALKAGRKNVSDTTLTINGALTFASNAKLAIFASGSQATRADVTGQAQVSGATVTADVSNVSFKQHYTILTAQGGVDGRFSGARTNLPFLSAKLDYAQTSVGLTFLPNIKALIGAAATRNDGQVASGIGNAAGQTANLDAPLLHALYGLPSTAQGQAALATLSGQGIAASQNQAFGASSQFTGTISDQTTFYKAGSNGNSVTLTEPMPAFQAYASQSGERHPIRELADLPTTREPVIAPIAQPRTWRAWATGFGGVENINGNAAVGTATQNNSIYGGTLGVDYALTPNYLIGVALGGSDGSFSVPGAATTGSTAGGHIALYNLATFGPFYGASTISFSAFTNKTTRTVAGIGALSGETERANFASHEFRTRLEFGRHIEGFGAVLTPFVALELAELRANGFNETATSGPGLFALNVGGQSTASVPSFVGARLQRVTALGSGVSLTPTLQVAYVHDFSPQRPLSAALLSLPGSTFLIDGTRPAANLAQVTLGSELTIGSQSVLYATFDGEFSGISQSYAGRGGFRYFW